MQKNEIIEKFAVVTKDGYIIYDHYEYGRFKKGEPIKIGKPFLDAYNKYIDGIHAAGFRLKDSKRDGSSLFIHDGENVLDFYLPSLDDVVKSFTEKDLLSIDYIETGYMKINGKITPVLHIYDESDLYFYDLNRLQEMKVKFKYCEDCDKLFIARKHQVRCKECQKSGLGEKKKYQNVMSDPIRHKRRNMIQKLRIWHKGNNLYQNQYKNDMIGRFNEDGSNLEYLDELHNKFKRLDKDILRSKNEDLIEEWNNNKFYIWQDENPEQWLRNWYKNAGVQWGDAE